MRRKLLGTCLTFILVGMTLNLFIPAKPYSILTRGSSLHLPSTVLERTRSLESKEGKGSTWGTSPDLPTTSLTEATADNITGFVSPDSSFHAITSEIQNAEDSIYILMYEFYHPELYAALEAAIHRGVSLTIVLENDTGWRNSAGEKDTYNRYYAYKFYNLSLDYDVHVYLEREYRYLHAKLVVIDNSTAIVMSANMDPGSIPANLGGEATDYDTFSRQWGCIIHGADACEQYVWAVENEIRYHATPYNPTLDGTGEKPDLDELVSYSPIFTTTSRTDVLFTPIFSPNNSFECLNESIYAADHYILLQLMYLSWGAYSSNKVNQLVFALEDAVERNVTVMVMLEEDMESYYNESKVELESRGIYVLPANSTSGFPL
ncbi:MAG: hypothetical protein GWO20_01890, partial [Candidatus Korarchaeota archaeon]|nr:hypothetical protein [Candidatus Korarchaeota archaeon]NIU82270.1 hypothetical protein [Candidatus Thorarchaeota archaeon]NIW12724.1 hypothetical protein [Candidatus Thorarchaeota archaeon]NIW50935.1 hypothetical protein [Candidatus Korarchaeota archaeon]